MMFVRWLLRVIAALVYRCRLAARRRRQRQVPPMISNFRLWRDR